jgi:hypothetical protein
VSPARASLLAYLAIFAGAWFYSAGPEFPLPDYGRMPFARTFDERIQELGHGGRLTPLEAGPEPGTSSWDAAFTPDAPTAPWALLAEGQGDPSARHLLPLESRLDSALDVRTWLRFEGGGTSRAAGLFWRARGPDDTYLASWDALAGEVVVERVLSGVRQELGRAEVEADPEAWHELRVSMLGQRMRIGFDGELLGTLEDEALFSVGGCGPWTAGDAVTSFGGFEAVSKPRYDYRRPWR